jgi:ferredoxin
MADKLAGGGRPQEQLLKEMNGGISSRRPTMPIKTGRTDQNGTVHVDHDKCTACGLCAKVCLEGPLYVENKKLQVDYSRGFGCMACGHCAAVCPQGCITVEGRDLLCGDIVPLPPREARASHEQLQALLLARRSIRHFKTRDVEPEVIEKILQTTTTAPMGIPPSDVSQVRHPTQGAAQHHGGLRLPRHRIPPRRPEALRRRSPLVITERRLRKTLTCQHARFRR